MMREYQSRHSVHGLNTHFRKMHKYENRYSIIDCFSCSGYGLHFKTDRRPARRANEIHLTLIKTNFITQKHHILNYWTFTEDQNFKNSNLQKMNVWKIIRLNSMQNVNTLKLDAKSTMKIGTKNQPVIKFCIAK